VALCAATSSALAQSAGDDNGDADDPVAADSEALSIPDPLLQTLLRQQARLLLFSTTDMWRQGGFSHAGLLWAPFSLDREGLVLKLIIGGGAYRYTSGALGNTEVVGNMLAGSVLPGYRFIRGPVTATIYLGYDFQRHRLTPDDPSAGLRGDHIGLRTGFELWYQPNDLAMVDASASVSTIGTSYDARLAAGLRAFDTFYVGPEVEGFSADGNYHQLRAGLHVTGLRLGDYVWSAGIGWATDSDDHSGAYGKLGVFTTH
jgi:hypothetical protein